MTVEAIKDAIAGLPEEERSQLAAWVIEQAYDEWDRQMAIDLSAGGRGHHLYDQINREIDEGKFRPMRERLHGPQKRS